MNLGFVLGFFLVVLFEEVPPKPRWIPIIELAVEETMDNKNTIRVPDINGLENRKVDLKTRTGRVTFQWLF